MCVSNTTKYEPFFNMWIIFYTFMKINISVCIENDCHGEVHLYINHKIEGIQRINLSVPIH